MGTKIYICRVYVDYGEMVSEAIFRSRSDAEEFARLCKDESMYMEEILRIKKEHIIHCAIEESELLESEFMNKLKHKISEKKEKFERELEEYMKKEESK